MLKPFNLTVLEQIERSKKIIQITQSNGGGKFQYMTATHLTRNKQLQTAYIGVALAVTS